jgi:hypothetical protein
LGEKQDILAPNVNADLFFVTYELHLSLTTGLVDSWKASPISFSLKYTGAASKHRYPKERDSLIVDLASDGDIPSVPKPIFGRLNEVGSVRIATMGRTKRELWLVIGPSPFKLPAQLYLIIDKTNVLWRLLKDQQIYNTKFFPFWS